MHGIVPLGYDQQIRILYCLVTSDLEVFAASCATTPSPRDHLFVRDDHEARSIGIELFAFLAVCFNSLEPSAS